MHSYTGSSIVRLRRAKREQGVALLLVIFIVALASVLVVNLTYQTSIHARIHAFAEREVRSEYVLKSAVNFARALLKADSSPEDGAGDPWWPFVNGAAVPGEILQISQPNVTVWLEIAPAGSKISLQQLVLTGTADTKWRDVLQRLFKRLGFDDDQEKDQTPLGGGKAFKSHEMVANLIDYMDRDTTSYNEAGYQGMESDIPEGSFPNTPITSISELAAVPGFTPARLQKISQFLTTEGEQVNINTAPKDVLMSLSDKAKDHESDVDAFISERANPNGVTNQGSRQTKLGEMYKGDNGVLSMTTSDSNRFIVIAKVDYGTSSNMARARISHMNSKNEPPKIESFELF